VKRAFDAAVALTAGLILLPLMIVVAVAVKLTSRGPILYWSDRVGRGNQLFSMPKFRTMRTETPALPTHLLADGKSYLTPIGGFLRRSSLDELPQFWSVLTGDMSLVGPRPALFNQDDLVALRTKSGAHELRPGVTGWAQVNGRDALTIADKAALDAEYARRRSFGFDLYVLALTALKVVRGSGVSH
jgi:O-antigen biosynthesis protein WbqP